MIQSYINTLTTLPTNSSSVTFQTDCIRTNSCGCNNCRSWLCHNSGSAGYNIVEGGLYEIDFNATVSSATAGVVAFGLFNNGELIPGTLMAETLGAANDYVNIGIDKKIRVCCKGNANITVQAIPTVPTADTPTTPITTQVPIILSANFSLTRLNG
ncbi:hypothetical protein [uncultured Rikenella sp.]|uniref:hypothetical protein n=1 Tax=uncultured Rikenella sp. TaxID=368003 RepID=UPI0026356C94|nr:hypothetical protein [uncultured Rikenella sp.]